MSTESLDPLIFGHRLRYLRKRSGMTLDALRKASLRWDDFPEVDGHEGPANTYNPDEVVECVQSHRQALRVVS